MKQLYLLGPMLLLLPHFAYAGYIVKNPYLVLAYYIGSYIPYIGIIAGIFLIYNLIKLGVKSQHRNKDKLLYTISICTSIILYILLAYTVISIIELIIRETSILTVPISIMMLTICVLLPFVVILSLKLKKNPYYIRNKRKYYLLTLGIPFSPFILGLLFIYIKVTFNSFISFI